jgi:D-alanyl-D-alanine carboxypeptidase/D-alanyl-D-alanine-endopeptidase (penicillin-binding protein 4)
MSRVVSVALLACAWLAYGSVRAEQSTPPAPLTSGPVALLRADILTITHHPGVERSAWGVLVQSLDRNERLVELNPQALLVPASVAKLITVASATEAVGWNYRFETTIRATGPIEGGVLHGDLIVAGSGDPSIGGRAGGDLTGFVNAVTAAGIRRIEGRVIGNDDFLEEPRPQLAWAWDDLGYSTGVIFGALNFAENRMLVTIAPGEAEGAPTRLTVEPHATSRPILNRSVTGARRSGQALWPEQRPAEAFLTVDGTIPAGAMPARLQVSVGNPTAWFADVLRYRLVEAGVEITGRAMDIDDAVPRPDTSSGQVLDTYRSEPLSALVQPLLKESINLYAEAVLRLNAPRGSFPTNDAALAGLVSRLDGWGIPRNSYQIVDGSGLSRRNVVAPETLLAVLQRMAASPDASAFVRGLPIAGRDGSLEGRMRGTAAEGNLRAKTGTMSNIRSLAGYVTTRDQERLAFVILLNNFEGTGMQANEAIDVVAVRLADFTRKQ